jgi:hypothetical protein
MYIKKLSFKNLIFLDNSFADVDGIEFYGGTMWFPDTPEVFLYSHMLNDFRKIKSFPREGYEQNTCFYERLSEVSSDTVVISHHLPTEKSVPDEYYGDKTNCFYVSDVKLGYACTPKVWCHGHTHRAQDYKAGETRVVCNPLGYPGEKSGFEDGKVIEL